MTPRPQARLARAEAAGAVGSPTPGFDAPSVTALTAMPGSQLVTFLRTPLRRPGLQRMTTKHADLPGFTLIELMVIVAVLATITMVAYPTYQSYVRESGRGDAYSALLDLATRQERYFSTYNTYTDVIVAASDCAGPSCGLATTDLSPDGDYELSASPGRTGDLATSFLLTAKVRSVGRQADDERCAVLTIDWRGETSPTECW